MKFDTRKEAREHLKRLGLVFNYKSPFRDQDREYWWYTDGRKNVLLDHTATITRLGKTFHISNFERNN